MNHPVPAADSTFTSIKTYNDWYRTYEAAKNNHGHPDHPNATKQSKEALVGAMRNYGVARHELSNRWLKAKRTIAVVDQEVKDIIQEVSQLFQEGGNLTSAELGKTTALRNEIRDWQVVMDQCEMQMARLDAHATEHKYREEAFSKRGY